MNFLRKKLTERVSQNSLRTLKTPEGKIDFCSNDYLGIATNKLIKIASSLSHGSTGSRLLAGNNLLTQSTENLIAEFHSSEAALIFNSGYDANLGLLSCIANKEDTIIYDQLSHASIRDGIRLSRAQSFSFLHNDINDLKKKLTIATGNVFVITESVFSMDGDKAPLLEISNLCIQYSANLIVDEAHAVGILGNIGEGLAQHLKIQNYCFARIVTFGKACGVHGAAVVGSLDLRNYLINFARSFIYTTALPESSIAAINAAYRLLPQLTAERAHLKILIDKVQMEDVTIKKSDTPIQAKIISGNIDVKMKADSLQASGFDVRPILYPTVPKGSERLRIILHSFNTIDQVSNMLDVLNY